MKTTKDKLLAAVDSLLNEGIQFLNKIEKAMIERYGLPDDGEFEDNNSVPTLTFSKWNIGCLHLLDLLGTEGSKYGFTQKAEPNLGNVRAIIGTLQAIRHALAEDLLITIEDLVYAEAFSDLIEQAAYLQDQGYFLAAGVLGRAVLEEHLRRWCYKQGCVPARSKPTMADYTSELYKATHLDKVNMKHVEAMAAIGNEAAHNIPTLKSDDVKRLLRDVREFLVKNPA